MKKKAQAIMFVGTGSNVGKSIFTAGLCRILMRKGIRVSPFKAQNMALNSYVTSEGDEIGRAQAYQAYTAGLKPDVRMNPVLMKPSADNLSQIIVMGKPSGNYQALPYYNLKSKLKKIIRNAYDSLAAEYDVVVIEGAGSPAEINLYKHDMVNMSMAEYAAADVFLIGDIDKGGVFASLKGTIDLLSAKHKKLIKGIIINKFRGDINLLTPAFKMFRKYYKIPFIGTVPYNMDLRVEEEDSLVSAYYKSKFNSKTAEINIGIIRLPHISNFTDFDAFEYEKDSRCVFFNEPSMLKNFDCVIIPGTKATAADFEYLKNSGLASGLKKFAVEKDKLLVGICGGFQMLGKKIIDKNKIESDTIEKKLLGFLNISTELVSEKILKQVITEIKFLNKKYMISGYEVHNGNSIVDPDEIFIHKENILGTYVHGIFDNDEFRRAFLNLIRNKKKLKPIRQITVLNEIKEKNMNNLADFIEKNIDVNYILNLINIAKI